MNTTPQAPQRQWLYLTMQAGAVSQNVRAQHATDEVVQLGLPHLIAMMTAVAAQSPLESTRSNINPTFVVCLQHY